MDGDGANKKRGTQRQLTKENYKEEETHGEDGPGGFERATEAELKTRQIRRVRRTTPTATSTSTGPNPFARFSLSAPTTETKPSTETEAPPTAATPLAETEQPDETPAKEDVEKEEADEEAKEEAKVEEKPEESEKPTEKLSLFGTPAKTDVTSSGDAAAPSASVSTSAAPSFQPVDFKSGEEGEETVFTEQALFYTNVESKWVAGGNGEVKINTDSKGLARIIMRQDVTLHLILNARLYPAMKPMPMGENAVTFSCKNFVSKLGESKNEDEEKEGMDIVALRFKIDAKTKVEKFLEAVEAHKGEKVE